MRSQFDDIRHAEIASAWQPTLDFVLEAEQFLEGANGRIGKVGVLAAVVHRANFYLATLDVLRDVLPKGGFGVAQLVGQAKTQIQKAAVDRSNFQAKTDRSGG